MMTGSMDTFELALAVFAPIEHASILDVGCGGGQLARRLSDAGADVSGVDASEAAVSLARQSVPTARFEHAVAEALPFLDASFDHAIFLNSLHHVDSDSMDKALYEALRVIKPGGSLLVIEPVAGGPFFDVFRIIEDETQIRQQAQAAIDRLVGSGDVEVRRRLSYDRRERFLGIDQFIARVADVDPARRSAISAHERELSELFDKHSLPGDDRGRILVQPLVAIVLSANSNLQHWVPQ